MCTKFTPSPHSPVFGLPTRGRGINQNMFASRTIICLIALALAGCASYQVGSETLYAPDVQTVYVPVIESYSFRRDLGERLTEAVIKEIEAKTPFKVVGTPDADSVLNVKLLGDNRTVLAEDSYDAPRAMETYLRCEVTWLNRRRLPLMATQAIPLSGEVVGISQSQVFVPAGGQSVTSNQQAAIQRLATQIVGAMEESW